MAITERGFHFRETQMPSRPPRQAAQRSRQRHRAPQRRTPPSSSPTHLRSFLFGYDLILFSCSYPLFSMITGGWATAPDVQYAWGYCFKQEQGNPPNYCVQSAQWPCAAGKSYYGRGPIQISYNYNYGQAGRAINSDLLNNPDLVATDPTISFKTAVWFWMTAQSPKPSCHAVATGAWSPSAADQAAGRVPGFGVITNIINGGVECGHGADSSVADRIGFYKRYCDILGVSYGANLDCYNQQHF